MDNVVLHLIDDGEYEIDQPFDFERLNDDLLENDTVMNCEYILKEIGEYTVKQLMLICDYYEISKSVKMCKFKKNDILETIILFESNFMNEDKVKRRRQLWRWLDELKKEKVLKKCIIWPITN